MAQAKTKVKPKTETSSVPRLLTQKELAQKLDVSRQTMWRWRLKGLDIPYVMVGSRRYYKEDEINAWLKSEHKQTLDAKN